MSNIGLKEQKGKNTLQSIMTEKKKGQINMKKEKAFTLMELMIVMAVMAILVGIALPRFKGMQQEGNIAKASGELRTLQTALESYAMHHSNTYPASSTTPFVDYLDASAAPGPQLIDAVLNDPFDSSNEYYYIVGTSGNYYAICSKGPDGVADVVAAEVTGGELTSVEINDDVVASNATLP